jgi:small subunit ribosomal protein S6
MFHNYETLLLARTEITNDELSLIEKFYDKHLADVQGKIILFDKWGKLRLAYPINKSEYGVYILVRYQIPRHNVAAILKELDTFLKLKCSEFILRSVTVKLDANAPMIYARPDTVEMGRSGSFDTFLKENKMDLLHSVGGAEGGSDDLTGNDEE